MILDQETEASCLVVRRTHIGGRLEQQDQSFVRDKADGVFVLVCDGMGGTEHGAVASQTAVDHAGILVDCLWDSRPGEDTVKAMGWLLSELDSRVRQGLGARRGGTTAVMAFLRQGQLYWASAGDSRLYICRGNELVQATRDHNYLLRLREQLRDGQLTQEQFQTESARGEALISYLGLGGLPVHDLTRTPLRLAEGDILLLTTDGLYRALSQTTIQQTLSGPEPLDRKADSLMEQVLARSEDMVLDNTTFVLLQIGMGGILNG